MNGLCIRYSNPSLFYWPMYLLNWIMKFFFVIERCLSIDWHRTSLFAFILFDIWMNLISHPFRRTNDDSFPFFFTSTDNDLLSFFFSFLINFQIAIEESWRENFFSSMNIEMSRMKSACLLNFHDYLSLSFNVRSNFHWKNFKALSYSYHRFYYGSIFFFKWY